MNWPEEKLTCSLIEAVFDAGYRPWIEVVATRGRAFRLRRVGAEQNEKRPIPFTVHIECDVIGAC